MTRRSIVAGDRRPPLDPRELDAPAEVATGLESYDEAARWWSCRPRALIDLGLVRCAPDQARADSLENTLRGAMGDDAFEATEKALPAVPGAH